VSVSPVIVDFDEGKIDAIFAGLNQCRLPGAMVGIAIGGRPVYRKGFGLANLELPVGLSPTMRARIGSTTKHFTCLTCMLLCEQGRASLDDPLGKFLPELHPTTRTVTLRQLMGNTSGLLCVYDICSQFGGLAPSVTSDELISHYRELDAVNAAPGTRWIYSNGGFELVRAVIERITGRRLEEVMRERLFGPLGMSDTLLHRSWDGDFLPNRAAAHALSATGRYEKWTWFEIVGAGGILSTIDDMLRWMAHMDEPFVGNAETWAAIKAPQTLSNGTSTGYGLGLFTTRYRGVETLHHAGGGLGSNAQMLKVPAAGLDVIIMVNRSDISAVLLAHKVLDACLPDLQPTASIPTPLAAGTFRSSTTGRVIQLLARDGQQIASVGGNDIPVAPDAKGVLRPQAVSGYLKHALALVGDPERPEAIQLDDFGNLDQLAAVKSSELANARAITGEYRSDATATHATITETSQGLCFHTAGRFGSMTYVLEYLADGIWRARSPALSPLKWLGGIVSFDPDARGFHYSTLQTLALRFRRIG
jgi:D-aminopeptidase